MAYRGKPPRFRSRAAQAKSVKAHAARAAKFKSALPSAPAAWLAKRAKVQKYKAARPKNA
jgi:hypothetical protein